MTRLMELAKWICFGAMVYLLVITIAKGTASSASFESVWGAVTGAADLTKLAEGDSQMVRRLYGLNPDEYRDIELYYPASNMAADELLLVQLTDASQEAEVVAAIEQRRNAQKDNFEGYGAEQSELLSHSIIEAKGNYVLFAVTEDAAAQKDAFLKAL